MVPHILVQFMFGSSSVVVQSNTGQQLDNNWTTTGQQAKNKRRTSEGQEELIIRYLQIDTWEKPA
jgi:hypothetical protein